MIAACAAYRSPSAEYGHGVSLAFNLLQPGDPDPRGGTRTRSIASIAAVVAAVALVVAAIALAPAAASAANVLMIAAGVTALVATVLLTAAAPAWLVRLRALEADSRLIGLSLWAIPLTATVLAAAGAIRLFDEAMLASAHADPQSFILGSAGILALALYAGVASTLWGLRLSIERSLRRRGWRPRREIGHEMEDARRRAIVDDLNARIDRNLAASQQRPNERFLFEVIDDVPGGVRHQLAVTDQRLFVRGEEPAHREHSDLVSVARGEDGSLTISHVGREPLVLSGSATNVRRLARLLERSLPRR